MHPPCLEESVQRAQDLQDSLPIGDDLGARLPGDILALLLIRAVGEMPLCSDQVERLVYWAESTIDAMDLDALDHDTLRHTVGLSRSFGRGGRPPARRPSQ